MAILAQEDTTVIADSLPLPMLSPDAVDAKITYQARDSIRFDLKNQKLFLFGESEVFYKDIELKAEEIDVDIDSNKVVANGKEDSLGNYYGSPYMKEADNTFDAYSIKYNFKTKKGLINKVVTNEGESYIHGKKVYKDLNDILYIKNAKYTTCNLENPHYHFNASKLKIIPKKKIVTGPANLVIENAPTPLAIPFGFFPNNDKHFSGIIIPEPGESSTYGFFLLNGGYYLAVNDHLDARLTGDFYSKGSWSTKLLSKYKKRYGFNGSISAGYSTFNEGLEELSNFSQRKNYFFNWRHNQDPKSRPNSRFNADVKVSTNSNYSTDFNSSARDYLSNNFNSNISYNKSWAGKPYSLTINAAHSQNTNTKNISISLPDVGFNVSRLFPFKKKVTSGKQKFYEKIGISYRMNAKNQLTANDTLFSINGIDRLLQEVKNGAKHTIPINTSLKVLKNFTLTPSFNYTELWYLRSIRKNWNVETNTLETDTVNGFVRGYNYKPSIGLATKIYGMYQYKGKVIKALRHVVTPSVNFGYTPENRSGLRSYVDSTNTAIDYSIFKGNIYGTTDALEAGLINFRLQNNLEMKVRNRKDSLNPLKKMKILDDLSFATGYNLSKDSLNWSNISITGRTNILKKLSTNFSGSIDPYTLDSAGSRRNTFEWKENNSIGRLVNARLGLSFNLSGKSTATSDVENTKYGTEEELEFIRNNPDAFIDFNVPWTLKFSYNIDYSKPNFDASETITQTINFSGDISLTKKWKIEYTSGYDFQEKDFSYTSINFHRDLHCWEMKLNWVPFGPRKSYLFTIKVKASILQDLKLTRRNLPNVF